MTKTDRSVIIVNWLWLFIPILLLVLMLSACGKMGGGNEAFSQKSEQSNDAPGARHDYTDPDAPKTIISKEISSFRYEFSTDILSSYEWSKDIQHGRYIFKLIQQENGALCICEGSWGEYFLIEFEVPASALDELQTIIDANNLAQYNGIKKEIAGIPGNLGFSLGVRYASGESIETYDNARNHLGAEATEGLFTFFHNLAVEAGEDFLYQ